MAEARKYIDTNYLSFDDFKEFISKAKLNKTEEKITTVAMDKDKANKSCKASQVRATVPCARCGTICEIYSNFMIN